VETAPRADTSDGSAGLEGRDWHAVNVSSNATKWRGSCTLRPVHSERDLLMTKVMDLMTPRVISVRATDSLSAAAQVMWEHDCGIVPVLGEDGVRVVGVVTDRDICMATWSRNVAPSAILASDAMSTDLVSCSPNDGVSDAEALMRSYQIRRLPVLNSQAELVGILSIADITRAADLAALSQSTLEVPPEHVIATLATIGTRPLLAPAGAVASAE
jgi:CBS domain-containing protein